MEQNDIMDKDIEYIVRDSLSIIDFLYEIQSSYVNQAAVTAFNNFDMVFVSGCGSLLPWSPQMERILVLLRMCLKVNKYCFASGSAMLSLVFISASNFDRTVYFTRNLSPNKYFIEKSTGDIYNYHTDHKSWQPRGNAGIHNTKAAQEFQTLGKYVLKAPVYRPTKFIDKTSEVFTSKSNELVVYPRTAHLSHYAFENVQSRFVATSASKWDIHTFSFASADRAFKRGPVVIEYGPYCLGTYFDISIQYAPTVQIMKNFIRETVQKIQMLKFIIHVPQCKFKGKQFSIKVSTLVQKQCKKQKFTANKILGRCCIQRWRTYIKTKVKTISSYLIYFQILQSSQQKFSKFEKILFRTYHLCSVMDLQKFIKFDL
ncbi:hypothetical protein pb186bvf_020569 [Paramecium bursaria]